MPSRRLLNSRGDTIVEVLIAIAVVASVLSGAFAVSNRSLQGTRASQERAEAAKLVESQLESLKAALANTTKATQIFGLPGQFCLTPAHTVETNMANCRRGTSNRYQLSIQRTGDTFNARATWDRVGRGTPETVSILYKVYQP